MKGWPRELRRWACQLRREIADRATRRRLKMAGPCGTTTSEGAMFPSRLRLEQRILPSEYVEAKVHNLRLAISRVQDVVLPPGSIFSFWHLVGRPTQARGFLPGRSLLGGRLEADHGGGLCQLSGILHHLSLQGGLMIAERHPHSRDIYSEGQRYTPLGADATVAYGFKDLRVINTAAAGVCFRLSVLPDKLSACLCSPSAIEANAVEFIRISSPGDSRIVETRRRRPDERDYEVVHTSVYRRLD